MTPTVVGMEGLIAAYPGAEHLKTYRFRNPDDLRSVGVTLLIPVESLGVRPTKQTPPNVRFVVTVEPGESALIPAVAAYGIHPVSVEGGIRVCTGGMGKRLRRIDPPEDYEIVEAELPPTPSTTNTDRRPPVAV